MKNLILAFALSVFFYNSIALAQQQAESVTLGQFVEQQAFYKKDITLFLNDLSKSTSGKLSADIERWNEEQKTIVIYENSKFGIDIFDQRTGEILHSTKAEDRDKIETYTKILNKVHAKALQYSGNSRANFEVSCQVLRARDTHSTAIPVCASKLYLKSLKGPFLE